MADQTTVHADNLERMLADNIRNREQIADRIRERLAALEGEIPRLQGMLASLEACGTIGHPDESWTDESINRIADQIGNARVKYGSKP